MLRLSTLWWRRAHWRPLVVCSLACRPIPQHSNFAGYELVENPATIDLHGGTRNKFIASNKYHSLGYLIGCARPGIKLFAVAAPSILVRASASGPNIGVSMTPV